MNSHKVTFDSLIVLGSKTIICYVVFLVFFFAVPIAKDFKKAFTGATDSTYATRVVIAETSVKVQVADDTDKRKTGLSDTTLLKPNEGMFFIFDKLDFHGIWMKDMDFPIDIIWLDQNKKVVYISENISPETFPKVFKPTIKSLYVLEVNAGFVKNAGIKIGDMATVL